MTNAARAMPDATANPTCCRIEFPARVSDANVPARISPADPIAGPRDRGDLRLVGGQTRQA
jgi:hypothetical protein